MNEYFHVLGKVESELIQYLLSIPQCIQLIEHLLLYPLRFEQFRSGTKGPLGVRASFRPSLCVQKWLNQSQYVPSLIGSLNHTTYLFHIEN